MGYSYTPGAGPSVLLPAEPANSDLIAASCAQAIRQIKAYLTDSAGDGLQAKLADGEQAINDLAGALDNLANTVTSLGNTVSSLSNTLSQRGVNTFHAKPTSDQTFSLSSGGPINNDVALGTEVFDPDSVFASNVFTAPATGYYMLAASLTCYISSGSPGLVETHAYIELSSGVNIKLGADSAFGSEQETVTGSALVYLTAGQTAKLRITTTVDASCDQTVTALYTYLCGYRVR